MSGRAVALVLEDAAWNFMRRYNVLHVPHPSGTLMLRAAGVAIVEDALSHLVAYFDKPSWSVHLPPRDESPALFAQAADHEVGHVILTEYGVAKHLQDSLIDALTLRWKMHRSQIERVTAGVGSFSPPALIDAFPDYLPSQVLLRAAEVKPVVVAVHPPKGRPRWSSSIFQPITLRMPKRLEQELLRAAREERRVVPGYGGATAWPFVQSDRVWVALVYEPLGCCFSVG